MATSKDYLQYVLEQLSNFDNVSYKQMMGEYMLYIDGILVAYICDDRLLIKSHLKAIELLDECIYDKPYPGAKEMVLINDIENKEFLTRLFQEILIQLKK